MDELYELFAQVPAAHARAAETSPNNMGSAEQVLMALLGDVHRASEALKGELGTCPVFSETCPFKESAAGTGLSALLDRRSWSVLAADSGGERDDDDDNDNDNDQSQSTESATEAAAAATAAAATATAGGRASGASSLSFSEAIKEGTKASHKAAENVHFVRNFIRGRIDRDLYKQLIADLWHVYVMMEARLRECKDDPLVATVYFPEALDRTEALERDM